MLKAEMRRLRCRVPHSNLGLSMIGPVLLEIGTEEQKREHLPPIARGEILWSQGFSEPGAGSDLASLKTRAEIDGDEFVVTGSKIWTTMADRSDWMFCLVRTDPDAPKHQGISFVLFDMHSPEVSTRPIRLISGESHFCQTFLDGVRVARRNLVGELNQGWSVAKQLLVHERNMMGDIRYGDRTPPLPKLLARIPEGDGERRRALRERVARVEMDDRALGLTLSRLMGEIAEGTTAPAVLEHPQVLRHRGAKAQNALGDGTLGQPRLGMGGRRIRRRRAGHRAFVAAVVHRHHRRRQQRGAAQHHLQAGARATGGMSARQVPSRRAPR